MNYRLAGSSSDDDVDFLNFRFFRESRTASRHVRQAFYPIFTMSHWQANYHIRTAKPEDVVRYTSVQLAECLRQGSVGNNTKANHRSGQ